MAEQGGRQWMQFDAWLQRHEFTPRAQADLEALMVDREHLPPARPDLSSIIDAWPHILAHVRAADPSTADLLSSARPSSVRGRNVTIHLPSSPIGAVLDERRHAVFNLLTDAMAEVLGPGLVPRVTGDPNPSGEL
jgi:hypothetical protein